MTTKEICDLLKGDLVGAPDVIIVKPGKIEDSSKGDITFLGNPKYMPYIQTTKASAVIVSKDFEKKEELKPVLIKVDNVYESFRILLNHFEKDKKRTGISELCMVEESAVIGHNVYIGEFSTIRNGVMIGFNSHISNNVSIEENVKIGNNCKIYPGVKIYKDSIIGDNVIIHANSVIGSDGFGFVPDNNGIYHKTPQIGNVIIEDNVEIGANTTIDRATMGSTIIKRGVKLDNLVQIAHNVFIDENTVIAAQTGIAGSAKIGKNCMIGGQVGIAGHIEIPDGTMIQAQSGVGSSPKKTKQMIAGSPTMDYKTWVKSSIALKQLPDLIHEVRRLKKQLDQLNSNDSL